MTLRICATTRGQSKILCLFWCRNQILEPNCCRLRVAHKGPITVLNFSGMPEKPTNERISHLVTFFFGCHWSIDWWMQTNVSTESLIFIRIMSSVIPKNVSDNDGLSTFWLLRETPAELQTGLLENLHVLMALVRPWRDQHQH